MWRVIQGFFPSGRPNIGNGAKLPPHASQLPTAGGQPLPANVLQRMESFFAARFADVRIHIAPQCSSLGALAVTQGPHIHFAPGQYDPTSARGQHILVHELAHVVQQRAGRARHPFGDDAAVVRDALLDAEAERMATRFASIRAAPAAVVQGFFPHGVAPRTPPTLGGSGAGQPIQSDVRREMESLFGTSFSDVRIHAGPQAPAIGAIAFTQGSNIHFAPGRYDPFSPQGRRILGHELAHVVQQRTGRVRHPFGSGIAVVQDARLESEADRMGQRAMRGAGLRSAQQTLQMSASSSSSTDVRPDSPRAKSINNATGSTWDSMNTTNTLTFTTDQGTFGKTAVFVLGSNSDRSDEAKKLGYETITARDKTDDHLHAEMLVVCALLNGKIKPNDIKSWGVNRKICKYCGLVLTDLNFTVDYDDKYIPANWTNPYKHLGMDEKYSPSGVPWQ